MAQGHYRIHRERETGLYVHRDVAAADPDAHQAIIVSGEFRKVVMRTADQTKDVHDSVDYWPVEMIDELRQRAILMGWKIVDIGTKNDHGDKEDADKQHYHEGPLPKGHLNLVQPKGK